MPGTAILWPLLAQGALTLGIYPVLLARRAKAARSGAAPEHDTSATAARNLANQFELPVLFYAGVLALHAVNGAGGLAVALAWVFAVSRFVHAGVHLGSNRLFYRFAAFLVGYVAVVGLWLLLAARLLG